MGQLQDNQSARSLEALLKALGVIESISRRLESIFRPLPDADHIDSSMVLTDITDEYRFSSNFLKKLRHPTSRRTPSPRRHDIYKSALIWAIDEYNISARRKPPICLRDKIHLVEVSIRRLDGTRIKKRGKIIADIRAEMHEAHESLEMALSRHAIVFFTDVHKVGKAIEIIGSAGNNAIQKTCTAPLNIISNKYKKRMLDVEFDEYTDSHVVGIPIRQSNPASQRNVELVFSKALEQCCEAIRLSVDCYGNNLKLVGEEIGLMVSAGIGDVLLVNNKVDLLSVSTALYGAYKAHHFMRPHQLCVSRDIFERYLPEQYKNEKVCFPHPVKFHGKDLVLYEIDILGTGIRGLRKKEIP